MYLIIKDVQEKFIESVISQVIMDYSNIMSFEECIIMTATAQKKNK